MARALGRASILVLDAPARLLAASHRRSTPFVVRVTILWGIAAAALLFVEACPSEKKPCEIIPCPAPGFDQATCRCRPSSLGIPQAGTGTPQADSGDSLPACSWPSSVDPAQSGPGQCRASRAYLMCQAADGSGMACLSDDGKQCPPIPGVIDPPDTSSFSCHDACDANEYAVSCGGIGPGPVPDPPAACHSVAFLPSGSAIACCPCGS